MKPVFFSNPAKFRSWLASNHARANELWVGFYRVGSGKPSLTWPEAVDEALSFGWIDSVRKGVDKQSYTNRFTPRRPGSFWSKKNIASAKRLIKAGSMRPAGLKAFKARLGEKSGAYSFEQDEIAPFNAPLMKRFKAKKEAWDFFSAQPPGYPENLAPLGAQRQAGGDPAQVPRPNRRTFGTKAARRPGGTFWQTQRLNREK